MARGTPGAMAAPAPGAGGGVPPRGGVRLARDRLCSVGSEGPVAYVSAV